MTTKPGRNDPCPCGSGKKFKSCCWQKQQPAGKKTFKATVLQAGRKDLIERTFSSSLANGPGKEEPFKMPRVTKSLPQKPSEASGDSPGE